MSNKYLEKIAQEAEKREYTGADYAGTGLMAIGANKARQSAPEILGYHKLYHGTSKANAKKIRKEGFDPRHGGAYNAQLKNEFVEQSKGKNHFTKNYVTARFYAGGPADRIKALIDKGVSPSNAMGHAAMGAVFSNQGSVLRTRVSDQTYKKFKVDPHSSSMFMPEEQRKSRASTFDQKLDKSHIGVKGVGKFLKPSHLHDYTSTPEGRARQNMGLRKGGIGAGLITAGHLMINRDKFKKAE